MVIVSSGTGEYVGDIISTTGKSTGADNSDKRNSTPELFKIRREKAKIAAKYGTPGLYNRIQDRIILMFNINVLSYSK